MKTEEIIEGNRLIAEFMGLKYKTSKETGHPSCFPNGTWNDEKSGIGYSAPIEYHLDWNWLMPVVDKIKIDHDITIGHLYRSNAASTDYCTIADWKSEIIVHIEGNSNKIVVWSAVIEYIKWFIKNK
jgi:hypothetical protein